VKLPAGSVPGLPSRTPRGEEQKCADGAQVFKRVEGYAALGYVYAHPVGTQACPSSWSCDQKANYRDDNVSAVWRVVEASTNGISRMIDKMMPRKPLKRSRDAQAAEDAKTIKPNGPNPAICCGGAGSGYSQATVSPSGNTGNRLITACSTATDEARQNERAKIPPPEDAKTAA